MAAKEQPDILDTGDSRMRSVAGKYLTFKLADEEYGIEILKVVEIIKLMEIRKVPRMPQFNRGVINLRGKVIPVVELRRKFEMATIEDTQETCIIVVRASCNDFSSQVGMLVDTVSEVLDIGATEIEPAPSFGAEIDTNFIMGMAKSRGSVKILLDISRILQADEMEQLEQAQV